MAAGAAAALEQEVSDRADFISAQQVAGVCTDELVQIQVHALLRSIRSHGRLSVSEATAVSKAVNNGPVWSASHKSVLVAAVGELSVKSSGGGQAQDVRKQQKFQWLQKRGLLPLRSLPPSLHLPSSFPPIHPSLPPSLHHPLPLLLCSGDPQCSLEAQLVPNASSARRMSAAGTSPELAGGLRRAKNV